MKIYRLILIAIISLIALTLQASKIDSLKKELEIGNTQQQLSILEKLAFEKTVPANERIEFSQRAIIIAQKLKQKESEAHAKLCLGLAYGDYSEYEKALQSLHSSILIYEEINDKLGESKALTALGRTYFYLKDLDESLKYFEMALQIRTELGEEQGISRSLLNIGNIKANTGNLEEAMGYFKKALEIEKKYNNLALCSQCYNNIANIHLALGEIDKVLPYRVKALEIDRKLNDDWQIAIKTYNLAEYFLITEEPDKAYPYIIESKELAEKLNDNGLINDNVELLSWYYKLTKDYAKALEYMEQYAKSNKEIFSTELSEKLGEMNVLYETEKKEREKQTIQFELEKSQKDQRFLLFLFILVFVVFSFTFYLYYKKKKYNLLLQNEVLLQTNDLRNKNLELTESADLLKTAKEKAEESDHLKSAFLANMSHEIRTPMNSILGFSDLLKEPDLSGEEQQNYINLIEKGGERMLNIINDIVSISIIESGQIKVDLKENKIHEQVKRIYTNFKPAVDEKGLQFSFNKLSSSTEITLKTDHEKLNTIFTNLIKNAVKYTNKGSIEIGYNQREDALEFYVADTGIGISRNQQKAIFERFIQGDISNTRAYEGAGLGLTISQAYVEMLDGRIWMESELGKGSTFYFTLPIYN